MRYYSVTLDLMTDDIDTSNIWFAQGDIGGRLHISLLSNSEPIQLEGKTVYVFFERKDGITIQEKFIITNYENGLGYVDIVSGILDIPGKVKVTVKLYERDILRLSFVAFPIMCKKSIDSDGAIISSNQIDVIQSILGNSAKIEALESDFNAKLGDVTQSVSEKITELSNSVSAELLRQAEEVSEAIQSLTDSVRSDLDAQDDKLDEATQSIATDLSNTIERFDSAMRELKTNVNLSMESLSATITQNMEDLSSTLTDDMSELSDSVDSKILELTSSINQSLEEMDDKKIDYIVSEDEPSRENLAVGTIWIKPNLSVGD